MRDTNSNPVGSDFINLESKNLSGAIHVDLGLHECHLVNIITFSNYFGAILNVYVLVANFFIKPIKLFIP